MVRNEMTGAEAEAILSAPTVGTVDHKIVDTISGWAAQEPAVLEIYVFGSRVRGRGKDGGPVRHDTDLDIAIRMELPPLDEPAERQSHWAAFKEKARASLSPQIPWLPRFDLLEGAASPALERYVAECSTARLQAPRKSPAGAGLTSLITARSRTAASSPTGRRSRRRQLQLHGSAEPNAENLGRLMSGPAICLAMIEALAPGHRAHPLPLGATPLC